jgi:hypothetical protein
MVFLRFHQPAAVEALCARLGIMRRRAGCARLVMGAGVGALARLPRAVLAVGIRPAAAGYLLVVPTDSLHRPP